MALVLTRIGRYATAPENAIFTASAGGVMVCTVTNETTVNFWAYGAGAWMGRATGASAQVRFAVYQTDASMNPDDAVSPDHYTAGTTVSTPMTVAGSGGAGSFAYFVDDGDPPGAAWVQIRSGRHYGIAALGTVAAVTYSVKSAATLVADNERAYIRTGLSQPPPDPFGSYSNATIGHLSAYVEGWANEAPLAPINLSPSGSINDTAPTFTADHRDLNGDYGDSSGNGVDSGDHPTQAHIQVRQVGGSTLFWNITYDCTAAEQSADTISKAYSGTTLVRGTAYEWRVRTKDRFGAWGPTSDWTAFTPTNAGIVTLDSDPTGKIEDNTPDFTGRWSHFASADMTRVQVRLLSSSGTVLQTGADYNIADVASSAAPGTLFTVPWANTGFSTLGWGTNYQYQIRGKDATVWSNWSAARAFKTDSSPTIPASLSPTNGSIFTDYPLLSFSMADSDDTTGTGLTGKIRITRPDAGTVDVTATYNGSTGKWEFQTTATELDEYGTFSWYAYGFDGTLYSGGVTVEADASHSATMTFIYALGPTVTIDSPSSSDTLTTASFAVTWTTTDQVKYKVAIYPAGETDAVYESNDGAWTVSAAGSHSVPSGYVRNGETYDIVVTVEDDTPLSGSATVTDVLIDYTAPDPVANFAVTPVPIGFDLTATAIRLSWDETEYSAPEFVEYTIYRRADGGPDEAEIILARITDPSVVALIDYTPASTYEYTYGIRIITMTGLDEVESAITEASATVTLETTVLTLAGNGGTYRADLTNVTERPDRRVIDEAIYQPLSATKPTTVRGRTRYYTTQIEAIVRDTGEATARQRMTEFEALDAQGGTVCMRYHDGTKRFGKIVDLAITPELAGYFSVAFTFREEAYTEGGVD